MAPLGYIWAVCWPVCALSPDMLLFTRLDVGADWVMNYSWAIMIFYFLCKCWGGHRFRQWHTHIWMLKYARSAMQMDAYNLIFVRSFFMLHRLHIHWSLSNTCSIFINVCFTDFLIACLDYTVQTHFWAMKELGVHCVPDASGKTWPLNVTCL